MSKQYSTQEIIDFASQSFKIADSDNSGSLDRDELMILIQKIAKQLEISDINQEEIDSLFEVYDDNKDGLFQLDEFTNFIVELFETTQNIISGQNSDEAKPVQKNENKFMEKVKAVDAAIIQKNDFIELLMKAKRQSKASIILDQSQILLQEEIFRTKNFISKDISVEQWKKIHEKEEQLKQRKLSNMELKMRSDKRALKRSDSQIVQSKNGIISVYTSMTPKSSQESIIENQDSIHGTEKNIDKNIENNSEQRSSIEAMVEQQEDNNSTTTSGFSQMITSLQKQEVNVGSKMTTGSRNSTPSSFKKDQNSNFRQNLQRNTQKAKSQYSGYKN